MNAWFDLAMFELSHAPRWLLSLGDVTFKASIILAACAVGSRLLKHGSASGKHLLWTSGVLAILLLPAMNAALPSWQVEVLPSSFSLEPKPAPAPLSLLARVERPQVT